MAVVLQCNNYCNNHHTFLGGKHWQYPQEFLMTSLIKINCGFKESMDHKIQGTSNHLANSYDTDQMLAS